MADFIQKSLFYHLPHNAVLVDEFNFLVKKIDPSTKYYTASELQRLFLIEQVKEDMFRVFHPKPYSNFTSQNPPDEAKLRGKFHALSREPQCPRNTIKEVYDEVKVRGPDAALSRFLQNRRDSFHLFVSDPENDYGRFIMTPYTTQKQWKYNWAEFVRDYIQFLSYIGIIPAYYKGWGKDNQMSGSAGFVVSKLGEKYINGEISLPKMLMRYKYQNSLINLDSYPQYARKVRPFYAALQILAKLKAAGINGIERHLLSGFVSCIRNEAEIDKIASRFRGRLRRYPRLRDIVQLDDAFYKEIGRFALPLVKFLIQTNLATVDKRGASSYLRITDLGEQTLAEEPRKIIVFNDSIGQFQLTPILGYVLKYFSYSAVAGQNQLNIGLLYESSEFLKSIITIDKFYRLIEDIKSVNDSPIRCIEGDVIYLHGLDKQYAINSSTDFSNIYDSNFVEGAPIHPRQQQVITIQTSELLDSILTKLRIAALESSGTNYENALYEAMTNLIGDNYVHQFGATMSGQRCSDMAWKIPIIFDGKERKLLVIFEAKASNAICSFDERKEKDNLINTIKFFANELTEIAGIWYIVLDGDKIPEGRHGGFRGGNNRKSFEEKLHDIQFCISSTVNKPIIVSAMNIYSFVEYYKYLYQTTRGFGNDHTAFNEVMIQNFWIWGSLFHPIRSYSRVYNDAEMIKNTLRVRDV